jgi:hypothetical protein
MSKKKGSTIITKTDAQGRIMTIDVHGPAADQLFRALLKENGMGQAPDKDMEQYAENKKPETTEEIKLPEPEPAKNIEELAEEASQAKAAKVLEPEKVEIKTEDVGTISMNADGTVVGEQG